MAGTKINDYAIGDANIQSVMLTLDRMFINGFHSLEYDQDNNVIAAGSLIEVGGTLYAFDSDESISGTKSTTPGVSNYLKIIPSGSSVTAAWSQATPVWSISNQGYYGPTLLVDNTHRFVYMESHTNFSYPTYLRKKEDFNVCAKFWGSYSSLTSGTGWVILPITSSPYITADGSLRNITAAGSPSYEIRINNKDNQKMLIVNVAAKVTGGDTNNNCACGLGIDGTMKWYGGNNWAYGGQYYSSGTFIVPSFLLRDYTAGLNVFVRAGSTSAQDIHAEITIISV